MLRDHLLAMPVAPLGEIAKYFRPVPDDQESCTLFVGNVGPVVGVSAEQLQRRCDQYGTAHVDVPNEAKSFAFVTFDSLAAAKAAKCSLSVEDVFNRKLTVSLCGSVQSTKCALQLHCIMLCRRSCVRHVSAVHWCCTRVSASPARGQVRSRVQHRCSSPAKLHRNVCHSAAEAAVPGLTLLTDFVTEAEEYQLLRGLLDAPWQSLARRRVCHFGFAFDYLV